MTLQEYNDLYKRPLLKQMTIVSSGGITIKNSNIVSEEMSLEKSLCSETNLRYGRCEAACFKVRIADINHDFTGEWLDVTQEVVTDSEGYLLLQNGQYLLTEDGFKIKLKNEQIDEASAVYGRFRVHSDKPSNDRRWRDLTCYDIMYDILNADVISWYNGLTFPMTLKNLRDSFFTYLGITQETTTLINDSFVTPGGFSVSGSLSGKTVIESICELNGVFGQITGDGKFQYVSLSSPPTLTLDYYVDGTGSYEDYVTDAVTGINAKGTTNDVGTIVGTDTNLYIIANNPLIYGTEGTTALTTALNTLLRHITAIQFRPFKVTTYGNPMLPLGTQITLNTKNQIIVSYVVRKELNGIQSLKDTISATSDKHQPTAVNSPVTEIKRSQGKIHELEINVDGLTSRVSATETNLSNNYSTTTQMNSAINQKANEITQTVSTTYETKSDATSKFNTADANAQGYANTALTTARSEITQLSNKVAVKVNSSGRLVTAELGVDPASSTSYLKVKADDIDIISNGNIQLTGKSIGISSTYFSVGTDGTISATKGTVGGWKITSTDIYDASADTSGSTGAGIGKNGTTYAFWAGADYTSRNSAPFRVGHGGQLIASNATITGTVTTSNLTATGGTVGGWSMATNRLYGGDATKGLAIIDVPPGNLSTLSNWTFATGGTSLTSLNNARFRVASNGNAYMRNCVITANSGGTTYLDTSNSTTIVPCDVAGYKDGSLKFALNSQGNIFANNDLRVMGTFYCAGTKSRVAKTANYGNKALYCYETPSPMFGDIGEGKIAEDGKCYVWLDSTFSETIKTESYQVFLQKYGQGECYVTERTSRYFIVEGIEGMSFGWEIKARQKGYENLRLDSVYSENKVLGDTPDYATDAVNHLLQINGEREVA